MGRKKSHVVIVGGGFGGLKVARGLRKAPIQITLIDRSNHHLFQPLLYQVATAGLSPSDIAAPIRGILRNQKNTEVLLAEVNGVDVKNRTVNLTSGKTIPYDYLILATGARHSYFGHDEWERFAPGLKSISDATLIRRNILLAFEGAEMETDLARRESFMTFIVIGGGPTGVEVAGAIAELAQKALASDFRHIDSSKARIILMEAGTRVLSSFPETLSQKAVQGLERLHVEVRLNSRVEKVDDEGVFANGQRIFSKTVIWAAGVIASPAGKWLGAETDKVGRVKVLGDLSVPGHPSIFVIGDAACVVENGRILPGLSPVAMQEGLYVARVIKEELSGKKAGRNDFHYFDKGNLATIGRSFAVADLGKIRLSGSVAWLVWLAVHIFFLIGFRNRILVLVEWAWAYFTFQRGSRLIVLGTKIHASE